MNIFKKFFAWLFGLFKSKPTTLVTPILTEPSKGEGPCFPEPPKEEVPRPIPPVPNPDVADPEPVDPGPAEDPLPPVSPKCLKHSVIYGGGPESPVGVITYLDCKGTVHTASVNWELPHISFCALEGTVQTSWSGDKVVVDGECDDTGNSDVDFVARRTVAAEEVVLEPIDTTSVKTKKSKSTTTKKRATKPKK